VNRLWRRRAGVLALAWLCLVRGHVPSTPLDSGTGMEPPPRPVFTAAAGAKANLLSCNGGGGSSGRRVEFSSLPAAAGLLSRGGGSSLDPTSVTEPSGKNGSTACLDHASHGRLVAAGLSGGELFHRKREQQQQQPPLAAAKSNGDAASPWPEARRVLKRCLARAASGGIPGAVAGLLQVVTLMWLRTIVNYQCRYGTSIVAAASELYRQGGVLRFYRGVVFALVSNPMSRFGMAAANEGAMALSDALPMQVSVTFTTWIASLFAGVWRVVLTPLDTCKTVLQVEGPKGFASLMKKVWGGHLGCLYQGATAAAAATAVGYFPWFLTFNYLNGRLRRPSALAGMLLRNAGIGLASSVSSDVCSNSIRVLKTTKQAAAAYDSKVTYRGAAALVIENDGLLGLFGRGLSTRILANGLQSMLFTVVWRYLHDKYVVPRREAAELRDVRYSHSRKGSSSSSRTSRRSTSAPARTARHS
ncbi:unnamed protein product, partial [Ectocarpus sp. 8 AP-2014]